MLLKYGAHYMNGYCVGYRLLRAQMKAELEELLNVSAFGFVHLHVFAHNSSLLLIHILKCLGYVTPTTSQYRVQCRCVCVGQLMRKRSACKKNEHRKTVHSSGR